MALPECTLDGCNLVPPVYPEAGCAPTVRDGEIKYLYIGDADWATGDTAEFTTRVDNTGVATDAVTRIAIIGTMSEPEQTETIMEGGVTGYSIKTFTVEFEKYEDSDTAYEAMRKLECQKPSKVWFGNDTEIMGAASDWKVGISTVVKMARVMEGQDTIAKYVGSFTWKSQFSPDRTTNPDPLTGNTVT